MALVGGGSNLWACFTGVDGVERVPSRGGVSSCSSGLQQATTCSSTVDLFTLLTGGIALLVNPALVKPSPMSVVVRPSAEREKGHG